MLSEDDMRRAFQIGRDSDASVFYQNAAFMELMKGPGGTVRPPDDKRALIDEYARGQIAGVIECAEGIE